MITNSNECKHHPIAQLRGINRFAKMISYRETCFYCSSCGVFLRIPSVYTSAYLKIGYLLFSLLITIGIYQVKYYYKIYSVISNFLTAGFIYLLMIGLQIVFSTALLSFSAWEQTEDEKDAQIQLIVKRKHDDETRICWSLGVSLAVGYIVGLPWWVLLIVLIVTIFVVISRDYNSRTGNSKRRRTGDGSLS